ncbi:MAG: hypothetical protein A3J51_02595 [Omnitrophica WOR_2 bacterium RIFCSPHIGHO2_02_FULL_45_21]|nr:MAG: hypothetical protein A3J51_02595 [Omnitrophica WOR_2 bacterium RIFCSPHIGHO2_02_FULL_45_21]
MIFFAICFIAVGFSFTFLNKIPFLGRLPGDIYISKKNFTFYFPLLTSLLISALISLVLRLCSRR